MSGNPFVMEAHIVASRSLVVLLIIASAIMAGCKSEGNVITAAVINSKEVVTKCNDGIRVAESIQRDFSDRRNDLKVQEDAIKRLKDDMSGADPKSGKKPDLQRLAQSYMEAGQQLRQDISAEEVARYKPVLDKINKVLASYAKEHGLLSVQDINGFAFVDKSIDITQDVIKRVDEMK